MTHFSSDPLYRACIPWFRIKTCVRACDADLCHHGQWRVTLWQGLMSIRHSARARANRDFLDTNSYKWYFGHMIRAVACNENGESWTRTKWRGSTQYFGHIIIKVGRSRDTRRIKTVHQLEISFRGSESRQFFFNIFMYRHRFFVIFVEHAAGKLQQTKSVLASPSKSFIVSLSRFKQDSKCKPFKS